MLSLFKKKFPKQETVIQKKSYKTQLQEFTQAHFHYTPEYELVSRSGPEHDKTFTVRYDSPQGFAITASSSSIKKAEHQAAKLALEKYRKLVGEFK